LDAVVISCIPSNGDSEVREMTITTLKGIGAERFRLGEWFVYPMQNRIQRADRIIRLQHLSMQILLHLAAKTGLVATYDELLDTHWPGRLAGEEAVHRRIADLRRHLQDDARAPKYIETIPKRGYRLLQRL
jgi:DNA-binding winged helix-turn-helix (wHTH) protein